MCNYEELEKENESGTWHTSEKDINTIPNGPGIYVWYFNAPPSDKLKNKHITITIGEWKMMYVGISSNLRKRIRSHFFSSSSAKSTLRRTIGALRGKNHLNDRNRFNSDDEKFISAWIQKHGRVRYWEHENPQVKETELIQKGSFPLNYQHNSGHSFFSTLHDFRKMARGD